MSEGRFAETGNLSRTAASSASTDAMRGCRLASCWRSRPARQALRSVPAAAATIPEELYDTGAKGNEGGRFEFERTVSRLVEMQSLDYLALGHGED